MIRKFDLVSITEHSLTSVAKSATGSEETIPVVDETDEYNVDSGILKGFLCSCSSTDYDISIRTKAEALADSFNEICVYEGINKAVVVDDLNIGWINGDTTSTNNLYIVVTNNDSGNATGTISLSITNLIHSRFN
jgi:hypothetical protein